MNITCYKCGQVGHIRTNCPCVMKVRTVAVRADGTEDPEMDPQVDDEALPPDKEGEGDSSEHQEEQLDVHMDVVDFPYISLYMHPIRPQLWSPIVKTSLLTTTCKKLCIYS